MATGVIPSRSSDGFPADIDIIVGGGGQDSGQATIQDDLLAIGPTLQRLADDGVPMLVVCGLYQLFGRFFKTSQGAIIRGIGLFDIETVAGEQRLIGNIVTASSDFGEVIGYENHSGLTTLGHSVSPLGIVSREGARYRNVIGTYLHGSLLPKNPRIADFLIEQAVARRYGEFAPSVLIDDTFATKARAVASKRPR